jgi:hypothetical protein
VSGLPGLRLPSRWPTYALLFGSMIAILGAGIAFPALAGSPVGGSSTTQPPLAKLPTGPLRDDDPRPPASYSTLSLLTSPAPPPGTVLTASDVGVTPTTITFGVILPALSSLSAFGIDVSSLDPKTQESYWQSAVERLNAAGGVDGRRLQAVYATADILSADSQRAACQSLTEDRHVFAVVNVLGITGDPVLCVTRDHKTPYIGADGEDPSYYQISQGRLTTLEPSTSRELALFLGRLAALHLIQGHRIGVVHGTGPGGIDGAAVRSRLLALGARSVVDGPLGNEDPLVVTGEVAGAETTMHEAGVDTVIMLTNAVYGTVFATQAQQDRYEPTYLMSDLASATAGDSFVANMPPPFFRQALAVTTVELGRGRANLGESPLDAGCRLAYDAFAKKTIMRDDADYVSAVASCAVVQLLTMGLNGAAPNPTRAAFTTALDDAGAFALPGLGRGFLSASRHDVADETELARAHADCQCWYAISGLSPAPAVPGPG